ncbi:MAG TPA: DUF2075 domain-containing protein [Usitatibacteraceae bacterium]|nr:DUF2075 domain-containing protein [Usitatibacteraceae bacterium]
MQDKLVRKGILEVPPRSIAIAEMASLPQQPTRAWYQDSIPGFLAANPDTVIGRLVANGQFDSEIAQIAAWQRQVSLLKEWLSEIDGAIYLEFSIPRMGRRIDAVVLVGLVVVVIEFKVGATDFGGKAVEQVWDYALDLKNFHEASHAARIVPILVATEATGSPVKPIEFAQDGVAEPLLAHCNRAAEIIREISAAAAGRPMDPTTWSAAPYRPTPTIVEAARALYAQHSVEAIARHDAGARNLKITSSRVQELIDDAREHHRKVICFVTGVPGAGKTLVGLNVATQRREEASSAHAVFLSGNGPLVAVLREALTRDELARRKAAGESVTKGGVAKPVKAFIQNVHHFRDEALLSEEPPADRVVIFDEAQRAWNLQKTVAFMKQKKGQPDFSLSESAFLISYMDRHPDWAVIVCLVGGGQEIHTGEAGIAEWLDACVNRFPHWHLYISESLVDSEYAAGNALAGINGRAKSHLDPSLHLAVSMRSFRAENLSEFVKLLLDCEAEGARRAFERLKSRYPIVITRDLQMAKKWVRGKSRGSERCGLVASSKAMRLKPHAIDIRAAIDPVHWFLDERSDTRSSDFLEDCATEFQVQGLELDWTCVNWDGDLRYANNRWSFHDFRGSRWENVRQEGRRNYLRNAYRVLLTRARQGMVLFIPPGDTEDPTRSPEYYDSTFQYLVGLGIPVLS